MAPAVNLDPVLTISVTFRDGDKNVRTASTNRAATTGTTFADILTEAQDFANLLDPLSNCEIIAVNTSFGGPVVDDLVEGTQTFSDVERKGSFVFRAANGSTSKIEIPGIDSDILLTGTNIIDPNNADVVAFVNWMTGATPSVTGYGVALTELMSAKKIHRKSSEG